MNVVVNMVVVYHQPSVGAQQAAETLARPDGSIIIIIAHVTNGEEMEAGDLEAEEMELREMDLHDRVAEMEVDPVPPILTRVVPPRVLNPPIRLQHRLTE